MLARLLVGLALLCPAAAQAAYPSCPFSVDGVVRDLAGLLSCQQGARAKFLKDYETKKRREAPLSVVDGLDTHQRARIRAFLQKYPEKANLPSPEEGAGEEDFGSGALSSLGALFSSLGDKISEFFGGSGKKTAEARAAEKEARQAAQFLEKAGLDAKGLNLQKIMAEAKKDPAKTVKGAVDGYNRELDQNLDPSMKKFWKKGDAP